MSCRRNSNWANWCFSKDTFEHLPKAKRRKSIVLLAAALLLWIMRRLSPWEHIKHCANETYAWRLELYLIACWAIAGAPSLPCLQDHNPQWLKWLPLWLIVQTVQTNFYHEFWRTMAVTNDGVINEELKVFSRIRNLILAFMNLFYVTWLFGLFYWWNRDTGFSCAFDTIWNAMYFSFVTGSTLGYGEFHPNTGNGIGQWVVVFQIAVSLFLITVLLSQCVGRIPPLPEKSDGARRTAIRTPRPQLRQARLRTPTTRRQRPRHPPGQDSNR